jgi:hypothetical protein
MRCRRKKSPASLPVSGPERMGGASQWSRGNRTWRDCHTVHRRAGSRGVGVGPLLTFCRRRAEFTLDEGGADPPFTAIRNRAINHIHRERRIGLWDPALMGRIDGASVAGEGASLELLDLRDVFERLPERCFPGLRGRTVPGPGDRTRPRNRAAARPLARHAAAAADRGAVGAVMVGWDARGPSPPG